MERKEAIRSAYRLTGGNNFYDGMITCSTFSGKAVCRLVWDMNKAESDAYLEKALSGIPENFSGRLLEVPVGTGILTMPLYKTLPKADITCLGYSADMMGQAQEKTERLHNVRLGRPQATEAEVLAALKAAQCMDIVEKFPAGIHTVIGTKGVYLSGGEQQRIAIARAMLKNAPILILDEATAFADPDNEAKVQAAFARLAKGKTVLMIAHRLSTVANADCIYVVQNGQIAESGTKDELCAQNGLFARMWQEYQLSVQWKVAKEG